MKSHGWIVRLLISLAMATKLGRPQPLFDQYQIIVIRHMYMNNLPEWLCELKQSEVELVCNVYSEQLIIHHTSKSITIKAYQVLQAVFVFQKYLAPV